MRKLKALRISQSGFSIAEVLIALAIVALGAILVTALGKQISQFGKRANQTGAVLEIRSMAGSISRDSESWLSLMRSSSHTQGIFAGCIPDPKSNVSTFSCPAPNPAILNDDSHLATLAGSVFHVASTPLVSNTGDKIAGSDSDPAYLTLDGLPCNLPNKAKCYFKSTAYFFRSNSATNQDPGSVKFVIKLTKNLSGAESGSAMKPQYMSIDIGDSWKKDITQNCPAGSIKLGYASNGNPFCVKPSAGCADPNKIAVGVDSSGNTLCEAFPSCTNPNDAVILSSTKKLVCSSTPTDCGPGKAFLGYFAGNGDPICSALDIKCASNQIQVGITQSNGNLAAECIAMPSTSCNEANSRLTFNGTAFTCQTETAAISCQANQVLAGINADGNPNCVAINRGLASDCPDGQSMYGINTDGTPKCRAAGSGTDGTDGQNGSSGSNGSDGTTTIVHTIVPPSTNTPTVFSSGKQGYGPTKKYTLNYPIAANITKLKGTLRTTQSYPGTEHLDFFFDVNAARITFTFQGFHCATTGSWDLNSTPKVLYSGGYANATCNSTTSSPYTDYHLSYTASSRTLSISTTFRYTTGSDSRPYGLTNGIIYAEQ